MYERRGELAVFASVGYRESRPFIQRAFEVGINLFGPAHGDPRGTGGEILGRAPRDFARGEAVLIATKVFGATPPGPTGRGFSRQAILTEIDASMRRLGTD